MDANKPLLGINSGRLGFLCAMQYEEIPRFDSVFPSLFCTSRTLLEFTHAHKTYLALNDVVAAKSNFGETVELEIQCDGRCVMEVRGDGVILATPTGSTSYTLSAGGSILDLNSGCFILTPICPHMQNVHPIVVSDRHEITIVRKRGSVNLYADGCDVGQAEDAVKIAKHTRTLSLYSSSLRM